MDRLRRHRAITEAEGYLDLITVLADRWSLTPQVRDRVAYRILHLLEQLQDAGHATAEVLHIKGQALRAMDTRPGRGFLVGDTLSDMQAGRAAGVRTVLVLTGHGRRDRGPVLAGDWADKIAAGLPGAVRWILAHQASGL